MRRGASTSSSTASTWGTWPWRSAVGRGEYGWQQIRLNRAKALRTAGRLDEAEPLLRDLVQFAEQAHGDPSLPLFAALAELAEVLEDQGNPDHEAVFLRAHEVDDALQDEPDPDDQTTGD
jgi:hypothetical protein